MTGGSDVIPLNRFLNRHIRVDKANVRRIVRMDYPVYSLPVQITERTTEPYYEIERNMERLLALSHIQTRDQLFQIMGISDFEEVCTPTLDYLISIAHVREEDGRLSLTDLARESLDMNYKIKTDRSMRVLYFEALSMTPLPIEFYNDAGNSFVTPIDWSRDITVIDEWDDFAEQRLGDLLKLSGEERVKYNIPQEAIAVELPDDVKELFGPEITSQPDMGEGVILFVPLYFVMAEPVDEFLPKLRTGDITSVSHVIYHAVTGKRSEFFENLFRRNMMRLASFLQWLLSDESVDPASVKLWSRAAPLDVIGRFTSQDDYNLLFHLSAEGADTLMEEGYLRPLWDIAYSSVLTLSTSKPLGRVVRIDTPDTVRSKVIDHLLNRRAQEYREQDKSELYIQKQLDNLRARFA